VSTSPLDALVPPPSPRTHVAATPQQTHGCDEDNTGQMWNSPYKTTANPRPRRLKQYPLHGTKRLTGGLSDMWLSLVGLEEEEFTSFQPLDVDGMAPNVHMWKPWSEPPNIKIEIQDSQLSQLSFMRQDDASWGEECKVSYLLAAEFNVVDGE